MTSIRVTVSHGDREEEKVWEVSEGDSVAVAIARVVNWLVDTMEIILPTVSSKKRKKDLRGENPPRSGPG